jgi:hypothetical protein
MFIVYEKELNDQLRIWIREGMSFERWTLFGKNSFTDTHTTCKAIPYKLVCFGFVGNCSKSSSLVVRVNKIL